MRFCRREDIHSSRPDPTTANRIIVFAAFFDGTAGFRAVNRSNRDLKEIMFSLHSHIENKKKIRFDYPSHVQFFATKQRF